MRLSRILKRSLDLTVSMLGLIAIVPAYVVVATYIKGEDGGPVLYRGTRVGLNGRRFRICKFRTMAVDAERVGASSTADDDRRITRTGRVLRKYKIDELPQLINVFRGNMSLVGPRPQVEWAVNLYSEEEKKILSVKPGITDYASVEFWNEGEILRGSTDPDKEYLEKIHPEKIRLGFYYLERQSLKTDVDIIIRTVKTVFDKLFKENKIDVRN